MNDIIAYRMSQPMMFHQLMRIHGVLWNATSVTKEKLDTPFIYEELMRTNGKRTMPLLIPAATEEARRATHLADLADHCAWAESSRAYAVQYQTPLTQRIASMGCMQETASQTRNSATCQNLFNEHIARVEGICGFEEEPLLDDD
eukprot:gene13283-9124_t